MNFISEKRKDFTKNIRRCLGQDGYHGYPMTIEQVNNNKYYKDLLRAIKETTIFAAQSWRFRYVRK